MENIQVHSQDTFHLEHLDNGKFQVRVKKVGGETRGLIQRTEVGHNLNHHTEYSVVDHLTHFDSKSCMYNTRQDALKAALEVRRTRPPEVVSSTEIEFAQVDGQVILSFADYDGHSVVA